MKIDKIQELRGPNIWSVQRKKLIQMRLDLEDLEDRIFCNILHLKIDLYKCKQLIIREINKSNLDNDLKIRLIYNIRKNRISNRKILRKKIDIDLQGYSINIDSLIP